MNFDKSSLSTNSVVWIIILLLVSVIVTALSLHVGIFWDNVLFVSKMGNHLFDHSLFHLHIPDEFDPGHPPFIATVLSTAWKVFGKSLALSHWLMLPFVFGLLWQIFLFVKYFVHKADHQFWAFLLVVADPTLLSQLVQVTPETIQLFFFFGAVNNYLNNNSAGKTFFLFMLGIVSLRGMMLCLGVFLIEAVSHFLIKRDNPKQFFTLKLFVEYTVGALPALIFVIYRLVSKGWITANPLEPWGNAWQYEGVSDFVFNLIRNFVVLMHRFVDFGRIAIGFLVVLAFVVYRKRITWRNYSTLIVICIFSTIIIVSSSLLMRNSMGHRYFIPSYLAFSLLAFLLLVNFKNKKLIYSLLLGALIAGNFLVYPDKISQGWDSSLAHIHYWKLRKEAIAYIDKCSTIPIDSTASFFPNITTIDNVEMNGDKRQFVDFTGNEEQVLYSNVFNLSDEDLEVLSSKYRIEKEFKSFQVRVVVYKRQ